MAVIGVPVWGAGEAAAGPPRPVPDSRLGRWRESVFQPVPAIIDGRPRLITSSRSLRADTGNLSYASTATVLLAFLAVACAAATAMADLRRGDLYLMLIVPLGIGMIVGRLRLRGAFTGNLGMLFAVPATFVALAIVVLVAALFALLHANLSLDVLVWIMMLVPASAIFVCGLDCTWAERLRWQVAGAPILTFPMLIDPRPNLPLIAGAVLATVLCLWSAQRDIEAARRRLWRVVGAERHQHAPVASGFPMPLILALVAAAVLLPLLVIPNISFDLRTPQTDSSGFAWLWNAIGRVMQALAEWLSSLGFGEVPNSELPAWWSTLAGALGDLARAIVPVVKWMVVLLPFALIGLLVFYLVRRTVRAWRRWQRALASRRWGARLGDVFEREGRHHGWPRDRGETVEAYIARLGRDVYGDQRIGKVAWLASASCFAADELPAEQRAWADRVVDVVLGERPPPSAARRFGMRLGIGRP